MFENIYKGKKVLITGHTGFKGSWMSLWLLNMGAHVSGYSLANSDNKDHFDSLSLDIESKFNDIRDAQALLDFIKQLQPEIIFHLAAQPLVKESYKNPRETFETNVMGLVNLFEVCRRVTSVKAIIIITSDKCYANKEPSSTGFRESDPMGGYDPYSASKGCAEIISNSYQRSFFPLSEYQHTHNILIATARAGNVIGGGDWSKDRLVPDIARAIKNDVPVDIRNPDAIRPWQYVLEPLSGYLLLGQLLIEGQIKYAGPWNFGPNEENHLKVLSLVKELKKHWQDIDYRLLKSRKGYQESGTLKLDSTKAKKMLGWQPVLSTKEMFSFTADWYRELHMNGKIISRVHLKTYTEKAAQKRIVWAI